MPEATRARIGQTIIELVQGDITKQAVDAIVNAANNALLGGGGVDGAIHRAAGKQLLLECMTLGGCPTGEAKITGGYDLPAKHVIHTVGPVYEKVPDHAQLLKHAHQNSLRRAEENDLKSIAFPAISTGVYGYPLVEAAPIALLSVVEYIKTHDPDFEIVRFVLFDENAFTAFQQALNQLITTDGDLAPA